MPHDVLLFITWKTWLAAPSLDVELAEHLAEALPRLASAERGEILELAIVATHLHLIVAIDARTDVPRLVQRMKGASARFANRDGWSSRGRILRWERGYDSRSIGRRDLPALRDYFDRQELRHRLPLLARRSYGESQAAA